MNPRPLGEREQNLLQLYSHCQLGMTPQRFYSKWQVSQERLLISAIALLLLFVIGSEPDKTIALHYQLICTI
jgi:hypothetical protein